MKGGLVKEGHIGCGQPEAAKLQRQNCYASLRHIQEPFHKPLQGATILVCRPPAMRMRGEATNFEQKLLLNDMLPGVVWLAALK